MILHPRAFARIRTVEQRAILPRKLFEFIGNEGRDDPDNSMSMMLW